MPTPSRFTAARRQAILDSLMEGNSRNTAAALAGISGQTLSRWMQRGADSPAGSAYRHFAEQVEMAEAAARGRAVRVIHQAMVDEPKWAAWFLERRDPAFAPPAAKAQAKPAGPVIIHLSLDDGTPRMALPTSTVEVVDPDSSADSA